MIEPSKRFIINVIFLILILLMLYGFVKLIYPFLIPILLAIVFSVVYFPVYDFLVRKNINQNIASFVSVFLFALTVLLPLSLFGWLLFKEAQHIYPHAVNFLNNNLDSIKIPFAKTSIFSKFDIKEILLTNLKELQTNIIKSGASVIKNIFFFFVNLFVMLITMFFLFRDGRKLIKWFVEIIPVENKHLEKILNQFNLTTIAIVRGFLLTAFIQGLVATVGYYIAGLTSPILLGFLTMFSALIPFVGTTGVTVPISVIAFIVKGNLTGLFLFMWAVILVGTIDNFIRPVLIGREARLPISLIFLGIIGGLKSYGPVGLIIGPIFVSMVITVLTIYKENIKFPKEAK